MLKKLQMLPFIFCFLLAPCILAANDASIAELGKAYDDYYPEHVQSSYKTTSQSGNCKIIYLMYSRAEDVLNTLKDIFETELNDGSLTLTFNVSTNSIIMRMEDPDSDVSKDVLDVISSLDYKTGQVLIDVLVVELTVNDEDILNAEWKELFAAPFKQANSMLTMGLDHGNIDKNDPTSGVTGFKAFVTSGSKMKAFLNAYQKKGKAAVISSPYIVTANHREAVFKTGEKLPLIESTRPSTDGPINSYTVEEVGLELVVTPHINRAGEIDLEVSQTINSVDSYDPKTWTARMTSREAKTNLTLGNGETMVLGGFIEEKEDKIERRTPLLSNIPKIGRIFTSTSKIKKKTELMVFITPRLIGSNEDAKIMTKTMVSRGFQKEKTMSLLNMRKKVESPLEANQDIILDRRSAGWQFAMDSDLIDDLVWQTPPTFDPDTIEYLHKGSAPFGYGTARQILPAPVKTYLKPSEGVIFKKHFYVDKPSDYKTFGIKVASDNAAAVYINGKLVDEDPMMKMKDGHDFQYWNRECNNISPKLIKKGKNTVVVFLGNEEDSTNAYMDIMIVGNR